MIFKGKKGLATGILAIIIVMFIFALTSLIALKGWNEVNDAFQSLDDSVASPDVKTKIDNLSYIFDWGDKVFVMLFIVLLISYLISSVTMPTDMPIFFLLFIGILVLTTILAMGISNMWNFIANLDILSYEASTMKFTNFFMGLLPFITVIIGIAGAVLFYGRRANTNTDMGDIGGY